jgi:hypothetical protein
LVCVEDLSKEDVDVLETLFSRQPYWKRLWVIQEIANSREVIFQCGARLMGFETLEYMLRLSQSRGSLVVRYSEKALQIKLVNLL